MKARPFLLAGLRRRIGDGSDTAIWGDPWLRDDGNFRVITRRSPSSPFPNRVADLLDPSGTSWDVDLIYENFWPVDHQRILEIPVGGPNSKDLWVWHYTNSGKFSVCSCYYLIFQSGSLGVGHGGEAATTSGDVLAPHWKWLWQLAIPPKIKFFLWRACLDVLPTNVTLIRRKVAASSSCPRCGFHSETIVHAIQECSGMRGVWTAAPFFLPDLGYQDTMWQLLLKWKKYLSAEILLLATVTAWCAWFHRNKYLHEGTAFEPTDMLSWSTAFLHSYTQANHVLLMHQVFQHHSVIWVPPPYGTLKLNVDAAFPKGQDFYRVSIVARDWEGRCTFWCTRQLLGRPRPVDGEAQAVRIAVELASQKRWNSVIVEGDCLQVLRDLREGNKSLTSYGAILDAIYVSIQSFPHLEFHFVKRSGNRLAHAFASSAALACNEGTIIPSNLAVFA